MKIMTGGLKLNSADLAILAPLELHIPFGPIRLDGEVVDATYRLLVEPPTQEARLVRSHLRTALRWLLRSWQNSTSINWEDRLVFLKIATEALTGESRNIAPASVIESHFCRATRGGKELGAEQLLWRAHHPRLERTWVTPGGRQDSKEVSSLEHWYGALQDVRNAIVHGDDIQIEQEYQQENSPYKGPFVSICDRVMREAIRVLLAEHACPSLWRRGVARESFKFQQQLEREQDEDR